MAVLKPPVKNRLRPPGEESVNSSTSIRKTTVHPVISGAPFSIAGAAQSAGGVITASSPMA